MKKILKWIGRLLLFLMSVIVIFSVIYYRKDIPFNELREKYANQDSRFLNLMGMQVHYRDEGDSLDSVPLVLVHGTSSSLQTWDSLVIRLKPQKRIIRFDLPAFGLTGPNPEKDYSFGYYVRFLDSLLERLNVHQCILAGSSLGGGISWEFSLVHPQVVKKLILLDATGFPLKNGKGALGFKMVGIPVLGSLVKYVSPEFITRKTLEEVYADDNKVTDALVQRYYDLTLREGNREALLQRIKSGYDQDSSKIHLLTVPTLIIWGDKDQLVPLEDAYLFHQAI
ncbi:MAG TPA: alpha/beta hydrolase, partial [Puia sp.]|nr:alpha/beta hydrolase [Puia sp.]